MPGPGDDARARRLERRERVLPDLSPSRSSDSAVISALTGPIVMRTRLPSSAMLRIGPRTMFIADSCGAVVETVMSQG